MRPTRNGIKLSLQELHAGQLTAYWSLKRHRFKALRCGRRFGKTEFAKTWIADALVRGGECAWLAPQHKTWSETYAELVDFLRPILKDRSKSSGVLRLITGGRLDFWTLENAIAGPGRRYRRVVIDEAAFAKDGETNVDGSMMDIWEKSIKPTLFDYGGEALACSNSAGKNPDNFFYNICTDPRYGFTEFHATTMDNPTLPKRSLSESLEEWGLRREQFIAALKVDNDPLVYAQEYLAEFVDWSGVGSLLRRTCWVFRNHEPNCAALRSTATFGHDEIAAGGLSELFCSLHLWAWRGLEARLHINALRERRNRKCYKDEREE
jgi:hypothetical protein